MSMSDTHVFVQAMAPINDSKTSQSSPEAWNAVYGISALVFGCICFILTPVLDQHGLVSLPSRRQFLKSELRTSPQHETFDVCPICRDRLFEAVCLPCGHIFCDGCIRSALNTDCGICPYCRRVLFCEHVPWEDVSNRAKFTIWCIIVVGFLTLNLWASERYLRWRSEMMWKWDYFLEVELLVQFTFVALMSWIFPVLVPLEAAEQH